MVSKTTSLMSPGLKRPSHRHRRRSTVANAVPLMPILHELQEVFGYIDPGAIELLAEQLNVSKAEVYGVVTFYNDFRTEPGGACVVRVCRGEACQSMGAERLARHASEHLGVGFGGTTTDGALTLEQVFCLGNCALSPAVMIDDRLQGRVDEARFDELVAEARERTADGRRRRLRASRRRRPLGRLGRGRRGDRTRGLARGPRGPAGAERLPRHVLARAAGGGRRPPTVVSLTVPWGRKRRRAHRLRACSTARPAGSFWARPRRSRISSARRVSPSPASG